MIVVKDFFRVTEDSSHNDSPGRATRAPTHHHSRLPELATRPTRVAMPKRGGYHMGGEFDERYYSDSYGSHSEGDDEDEERRAVVAASGGYDRPRRRGTPGWGSRKSGGPWNDWMYWSADLDPIPLGYWRLELGAQRGAPARLLKPLQGSFAHNEQTLSASAATALKRAKEIFDEYITTVVDPPTIFELIPEHATFTETYAWNTGRNGAVSYTHLTLPTILRV